MFTEYSKGVILPTKGGQQQTAAQTNAATVSVNDSLKNPKGIAASQKDPFKEIR